MFFLAVGMSLNQAVVAAEWPLLLAMLVVYVLVKAVAIYATARALAGPICPPCAEPSCLPRAASLPLCSRRRRWRERSSMRGRMRSSRLS